MWHAPGDAPIPEQKREGESLMASDFLTSEWGPLCDNEEGYAILCNYSPNTFTNSNGITRPVFSSELQKIVMAILVTMTY